MSEPADADLAELLTRLVESLDLTCADGRAGSGAILREIEAKAPGSIARMQAGIGPRKAGASLLVEGRAADA